MEIPTGPGMVRTCDAIKRRTLKDGTVREYHYKRNYTVKKDIIVCGKTILKDRITACRDKEKIEKLRACFDELDI